MVRFNIKEEELLKLIPVGVLTSSRGARDPVENYEVWGNAYVVQPFDFEEIMNAVEKLGGA